MSSYFVNSLFSKYKSGDSLRPNYYECGFAQDLAGSRPHRGVRTGLRRHLPARPADPRLLPPQRLHAAQQPVPAESLRGHMPRRAGQFLRIRTRYSGRRFSGPRTRIWSSTATVNSGVHRGSAERTRREPSRVRHRRSCSPG
ncbi:hypothetical protein KUCAC02_007658 [Chaenocephalus aceratus]|uniref:Uncharacterized protein n=1 Tax=Chaenocephalus aceratus TaxID=36190 RepID=A0ACB9X681_CHAAC|nr:hypothetical protein KUCAC02_007658 [Chaenocephalus aceratus]